jgi:hypothetical protein
VGKRAVEQAELMSKSMRSRLEAQRAIDRLTKKPRKQTKPSKKETVSRVDFYEAARTLFKDLVVGVSQGSIQLADDVDLSPCCRLDVGASEAYLSDSQVRELIQVLRDYLSAKEE